MRRLAAAGVLALGLTFVSRGTANAQTTVPVPAQPWTLNLSMYEAYDTNVEFVGPGGSGDLASRFGARIGDVRALGRGVVTLSGEANQLIYRESSSLNHFTYGVGLSLSYPLGRRLSLRVSDALNTAYAQDSRTLTDAGLIFPKVMTRINVLSGDMTYDLSRRLQLRWDVGSQRVVFQQDQLSGGTDITTRVSLARQMTRTQTIGLSFGQTFSSGTTGDIQGLLGTWAFSLGQRFTLSATGGIRPYTLFGEKGVRIAPGGSVGLSARFGTSALGVTYERAVEQAFGFNRTHLSHRLGASYETKVGQRVALSAGATYGLNTYPLIRDLRLTGKTVNLGFQYLLVRKLAIGTSYTRWVRRETPNPSVTSYQAALTLGYGWSWR